MKIESSRQTLTEQTNKRTKISIYWAPDGANKNSLDVNFVLFDHYNQIYHLVKRYFLQGVYFYFNES